MTCIRSFGLAVLALGSIAVTACRDELTRPYRGEVDLVECERAAGRPDAVQVLNCTDVAIVMIAIEADLAPRILPVNEVDLPSSRPVIEPGEAATVAGDYGDDGIVVFVYEVEGDDRAVLDRSVGASAEELRRQGYQVAVKVDQ